MIEINGKNYEVHKVKLTKKDLKKLEKRRNTYFYL